MTQAGPDVRALIAAEYLGLARVLEAVPPSAWETPSLCEGWRVREVVAHVTMPVRYDEPSFMAELRACDFDFTRLSNRVAARDAGLPTESLVAQLRHERLHGWSPPGGGEHGALSHAVIHGLDITVPLGRQRAPDAAVMTVLEDLTAGGAHAHFGVGLDGRALDATDVRWSTGSGVPLRGTAADLVLAICGRSLPTGRLDGSPLARSGA